MNATVSLFHPSGARATIELNNEGVTPEEVSNLFLSISTLLSGGFQVTPENLEIEEEISAIGYLVRRSKSEDDGTETPIIDTYLVGGKFRWISTYLNNSEDVRLFEEAFGGKLDSLAEYEGSAPLEVGKNTKLDAKYLHRLSEPMKMVWKNNPRWEETDDGFGKGGPRRLFVRWMPKSLKAAQALDEVSLEEKVSTNVENELSPLDQAKAIIIPHNIGVPLAGKDLGFASQHKQFGKHILRFLAGEAANNAGNYFEPSENFQELANAAKLILASQS